MDGGCSLINKHRSGLLDRKKRELDERSAELERKKDHLSKKESR